MLAARTASALPASNTSAMCSSVHAPRDDEIEPGFRAVGVNGVQHNFARAERHGVPGPFERIQAGVLAAAVREHAPFVRRNFLRINGDDDALAAEFFRAFADEFG